jgi:hypothetical protein
MTKRNVMAEFTLDEISGVDNPAQQGARVTIMKRADAALIGKKLRLLSDEDGHTHMIDDAEDGGSTSYAHTEGEDMGHSHPWVRNDDGTVTVGMSDGHTHSVIQKNQTAGEAGSEEDTTMSATKNAGGEQAITKEQHDALAAELALAKAYGTLTDAHKAHAAGLPEGAERNAFINKSVAERDGIVTKATSADPVVYTCADGTELRKSAGDTVIRLAKRADASDAALAVEKAERQNVELAKRAADELGNLPGDVAAKSALLKAVDGISDATARTGALALLKAANAGGAANFETNGTEAKTTKSVGDAEVKLNDLATKRAAEASISFAKAYAEVLGTPEGRSLYAQTR